MSNISVERRTHDPALWQKIINEINHLRHPPEPLARSQKNPGIVIIGAGVSAMALARQLCLRHCTDSVTLINAEAFVPYNRAQLSSALADGKSLTKLAQQALTDVTVLSGLSVVNVDTVKKCCHLSDGSHIDYRQLVFATGALSQRFAPLIEPHPRIIDFRSLSDLQTIAELNPMRVVIVGGGLLGIEAARAMQVYCQHITLIERADHLMPQQLDEGAAARVAALLQDWAIDVHTGTQISHCVREAQQLTLTLSNDITLNADLVISATGVTPNTLLAKHAGIAVQRGIVVDESHSTSAPDVFAMGECCQQFERCFGSVNPCLQHAEALAPILMKTSAPVATRTQLMQLKLAQRTIVAIGATQDRDDESLVFTDLGGRYRCLKLREARVVGAIVFDHAEADINDVSFAVTQSLSLSDTDRKRFVAEGLLPNNGRPLCNNTICFCANVSYDDVRRLRQQQLSRAEIVALTGATTHCGSCQERLNKAVGQHHRFSSKTLTSIAALFSALLLIFAALSLSLPFATQWASSWRTLDQIWRHDWLLQITGYSLLAIMAATFFWGWWRQRQQKQNKKSLSANTHIVLTLLALLLWWTHTGGRSGSGLNFLLFALFATVFVIGAITGQTWLLQHTSVNGKRWAQRLRVLHFATLLPLPALLTFHILKHYYY